MLRIARLMRLAPYEPTAEQSAEIKQALKHDPCSFQHVVLARRHFIEADEAVEEVENGHDTAHPDSWVAKFINNK